LAIDNRQLAGRKNTKSKDRIQMKSKRQGEEISKNKHKIQMKGISPLVTGNWKPATGNKQKPERIVIFQAFEIYPNEARAAALIFSTSSYMLRRLQRFSAVCCYHNAPVQL
jgi:hypothetical protein